MCCRKIEIEIEIGTILSIKCPPPRCPSANSRAGQPGSLSFGEGRWRVGLRSSESAQQLKDSMDGVCWWCGRKSGRGGRKIIVLSTD